MGSRGSDDSAEKAELDAQIAREQKQINAQNKIKSEQTKKVQKQSLQSIAQSLGSNSQFNSLPGDTTLSSGQANQGGLGGAIGNFTSAVDKFRKGLGNKLG